MIAAILASVLLAIQPLSTPTGIPLDAPWNYDLGMQLARQDGLKVDTDVLFAAAFLHDMAAFEPCADAKMEHGDCAAIESEKVLRAAGFPMQKFRAVQTAERAHMYYRDPGASPEAIVLHDADSLDFLGEVGVARLVALTGGKAGSFAPAVKQLRQFLTDIPPHLVTKAAQRIGAQRAAELRAFLDALGTQTFDGKAM